MPLDEWSIHFNGTKLSVKAAVAALGALPAADRLPTRVVNLLDNAVDDLVLSPGQLVSVSSSRTIGTFGVGESHTISRLNILP